MAAFQTSELSGHLVSNIATRIFFQAAENTMGVGVRDLGVSFLKVFSDIRL